MKKIRLATLFSGIGAIEQAFDKKHINYEIVFACDNGERYIKNSQEEILKLLKGKNDLEIQQAVKEIYEATGKPNNVKKTYFANYKITEDKWFEDIRFLNGNQFRGKVDLLVGGSPCQSFSISGKRAGLEDARGTLFFDYARLIKETQPKAFIYENVPGLLSHDNGRTFKIITEIFDSLGYEWSYKKLAAKDFGIPQNRTRVFVIGFRKDIVKSDFSFPKGHKLMTQTIDFLEDADGKTVIDRKYFHGEKGFKWVTSEKSLKKRVSINSKISRTQAANQQFNWCGDMIFYPIEKQPWALNDHKIYVGLFKGVEGVIRKLTPRECLRLMGFSDSFKIIVEDNVMYRQSGNSIVVNVLEAILDEIIKTGVFDND